MVQTKTMGLVKQIIITKRNVSEDIAAIEPLPDTDTHVDRYAIKSRSGNIYVISRTRLNKLWECSCPGFIHHKKCKHMRQLGLPQYLLPGEFEIKLLAV